MSTCITVGLTAVSTDGKTRYNLMLHSFRDSTGEEIINALQTQFGKLGMPSYASLRQVGYYIVGGAPDMDSIKKANNLIDYLHDNKLPVLGVMLTTSVVDKDLTKAAMITAGGEMYYTAYNAGH